MKVTRKMLLMIILGMGIFLIAYGVFRYFSGIEINEKWDKYLTDTIILVAIILLLYNRKMASAEKLAEEAEKRAKLSEETEEEEE